MSDTAFRLRRGWKSWSRRLRELRLIAGGALSPKRPIMAHIIPIRRCNLSCTYCNEYDDYSKPVPTETMIARVNRLADLGTRIITLSGGEPLLHPELDDIIAEWTSRHTVAEVEQAMLDHGVPAGRMFGPQDMLDDPHFQAAGGMECGLYPS